jgi:hypothetical protein
MPGLLDFFEPVGGRVTSVCSCLGRVDREHAGSEPATRPPEAEMVDKQIEQIAATLDDIASALDEIKGAPCDVSAQTLERMRQSIEKATDAIDRMVNGELDPDVARLHSRSL